MTFRKLNQQRNHADWLAVAFLAIWPFAYFNLAALRQVVFYFGDIFLFFIPTHLSYANALREGRLPLWEPNMLAGFPLFAEGQIGALYPLHPLLYGLLPIDVATNYDILLHLAWVGIGTYLLARALRLNPPSACLAAFAFSTGGFFAARLQHMSVIATASWLPWIMWAWEQHEHTADWRKRWRWLIVLAVMSGIQLLGGHPQFAFSSALLMGLYAVIRWNRGVDLSDPIGDRLGRLFKPHWDRIAWSTVSRLPVWFMRALTRAGEYFEPLRLVPIVLAMGTGAALAAVQLMPTFELAGFTNRASGLDARFFNAFSLRPIHFLLLFNPFLLGNPWPKVSVEVIGYVGLLTLFLAVAAILVRRDRRVVFFLFIALCALFLGLGDQNIVYRAMRHLPFFNYFRVPSRFLFWFTFAAAMLAGYSLDYLLARAPVQSRFTRAQKTLALVLAGLIGLVVVLVPIVPLDSWLLAWKWLPLVLVLVSAWILLGARRGLFARGTLVTLVLGVAVVDSALFAAVYAKTYNAVTSVSDFYRPPNSLSALKGISNQEGRVLTSLWVYPWQSVMRESLYPNVGMTYNVPNAIGYTPLLPQYTAEYLEAINAPLANLMNVRYYIIPQVLATTPSAEGDDLYNKFNLNPVNRDISLPPTTAAKIKVTSSLSQSVDWKTGQVIADIYVATAEGEMASIALRAGVDTGEWAYERSDVRKVIRYPMPRVATSFQAGSALPIEMHAGHTYYAEFPIAADGRALTVTGLYIYPRVNAGLVHIDKILLSTPDGKDISVAHLVGLDDQELVYRTNDVAIYENPDVLPRAFIVHEAISMDDVIAADALFRPDFEPANTLIISAGEPLRAGSRQQPDESVQVVEYRPERVVLSVRASADGYVLLSDAWFPGWEARVDGVSSPIVRGDLLFRAVRVTPGEHRIEMEYHPQSLQKGAIISALAWMFLAAIAVTSYRERTRSS